MFINYLNVSEKLHMFQFRCIKKNYKPSISFVIQMFFPQKESNFKICYTVDKYNIRIAEFVSSNKTKACVLIKIKHLSQYHYYHTCVKIVDTNNIATT